MEKLEVDIMKCLDSDFLIAVLRGDKSAVPYMEKLDKEGSALATSISTYEILFGARLSKNSKDLEESVKLLGKLQILPFDEKVAERAGKIHAALREKGEEIGIKDIFIAATAIENDCAIVTRNAKDFSRIKGLEVEKW